MSKMDLLEIALGSCEPSVVPLPSPDGELTVGTIVTVGESATASTEPPLQKRPWRLGLVTWYDDSGKRRRTVAHGIAKPRDAVLDRARCALAEKRCQKSKQ